MKPYICPECGNQGFEEVVEGITQSSTIQDAEILEDGSIVFEYGNTSTDGGDIESIHFECIHCGNEVTIDEIKNLLV